MAGDFRDTIAADHMSVDGAQTVTVKLRRASDADTSKADVFEVPYTVRLDLKRSEVAQSVGRFTMQDVAFELPVAECPDDVTLQEGDLITDEDDVRWSILETTKTCMDSIWRVVCRKVR